MKNIFVLVLLLSSNLTCFSQETHQIKKGDFVANFTALNSEGNLWKSTDITSSFLVVYFYPAAMTSGCTKQACAYRDDQSSLKKMGVTVIGVSGDEVSNLKHFKETYHLNFTLLSDSEGKLAEKFGVPTSNGGTITRELNGESFLLKRGITASRWTFVLDKNRKVIYKNSEVNAAEDSKNIKKILQKYAPN